MRHKRQKKGQGFSSPRLVGSALQITPCTVLWPRPALCDNFHSALFQSCVSLKSQSILNLLESSVHLSAFLGLGPGPISCQVRETAPHCCGPFDHRASCGLEKTLGQPGATAEDGDALSQKEGLRDSLVSHGSLPPVKCLEAQGTPALTLGLILFCIEIGIYLCCFVLNPERLNVKSVACTVVIVLFLHLLGGSSIQKPLCEPRPHFES